MGFFQKQQSEKYSDVELFALPDWYAGEGGDKQENFRDDVLAMFTPAPSFKQFWPSQKTPLHKQVNHPIPWHKNPLIQNLGGVAREEAKHYYRFFWRFPRTKLFREILEAAGYNSVEAASFFLQLLVAKATGSGKSGVPTLLSAVLRDADNSGLGEFLPLIFGRNAGRGHFSIKFIKKALKVAELVKKLNIKYKSASQRYFQRLPSVFPEDDVEPRRIQSLTEIPLYGELLLPDEIFYSKLATRQLNTLQHYKYKHHAKKYVMLLDVSGSMEENDKYIYAIASAISLIKNSLQGANQVVIIPFDDAPHDPQEFKTLEEATEWLFKIPFSGGGTNIDMALQEADTISPDEVILITDGRDEVTYTPKTKLFTVFVGDFHNETLAAKSFSYEEVNTC